MIEGVEPPLVRDVAALEQLDEWQDSHQYIVELVRDRGGEPAKACDAVRLRELLLRFGERVLRRLALHRLGRGVRERLQEARIAVAEPARRAALGGEHAEQVPLAADLGRHAAGDASFRERRV